MNKARGKIVLFRTVSLAGFAVFLLICINNDFIVAQKNEKIQGFFHLFFFIITEKLKLSERFTNYKVNRSSRSSILTFTITLNLF